MIFEHPDRLVFTAVVLLVASEKGEKMFLKKFLVFGLLAAVLPAVAEESADRKTATSLKYVTHELDTRQNKFGADTNKAMEYTNSAGTVQKRAVTSDLDNGGTDSLPMVGGVNTKLNQKQDDIDPFNDHTAVTYTGQPGGIGQKGIYQATESYAEQSDSLIDAKTFNAALKTGLDSEFICSEFKPDTNLCWVYSIHNNGMPKQYVSATGTVVQDGTPTPTNPIYPKFFQQGEMILRKIDDTYKDSYDATTHKITRRVGVKVLDGTESWSPSGQYLTAMYNLPITNLFAQEAGVQNRATPYSTHFQRSTNWLNLPERNGAVASYCPSGGAACAISIGYGDVSSENVPVFKQWLAAQYAAGTPVTVYYPLKTPVEEDWPDTTYNDNVYIPQNQ